MIGERIRSERIARGMSQGELAALVGISRPHIGMIEQGRSSPSQCLLVRLEQFLEGAPICGHLLGPRQTPDWFAGAACRGLGPALFFPDHGEDPAPALAVCARCDVRADCLGHAAAANEPGIWGGTSDSERKRLRRLGQAS